MPVFEIHSDRIMMAHLVQAVAGRHDMVAPAGAGPSPEKRRGNGLFRFAAQGHAGGAERPGMNPTAAPGPLARLLTLLKPRRDGRSAATAEREFAQRLAQAFQRQGWQVVDAAPGRHVDLVLRRERETHFVQWRGWREAKVDMEPLVGLQAAMAKGGAAGGIVVTQGAFGRRATAFAARSNIRLIDGPLLARMLKA